MIFFRQNDNEIPQIVNQYLLPHEKQVITVHKHPAIFVLHCGILAVALATASLLSAFTNSSGLALGLAWGACFVIFTWLIIRLAAWSVSYLAVTSVRLIFITGFITHKVITVPLAAINDFSFYRTQLGRLLGYGVFVADLATDTYTVPNMNFMPYPEQIYLEICGVLFADDANDPREYESETEA